MLSLGLQKLRQQFLLSWNTRFRSGFNLKAFTLWLHLWGALLTPTFAEAQRPPKEEGQEETSEGWHWGGQKEKSWCLWRRISRSWRLSLPTPFLPPDICLFFFYLDFYEAPKLCPTVHLPWNKHISFPELPLRERSCYLPIAVFTLPTASLPHLWICYHFDQEEETEAAACDQWQVCKVKFYVDAGDREKPALTSWVCAVLFLNSTLPSLILVFRSTWELLLNKLQLCFFRKKELKCSITLEKKPNN